MITLKRKNEQALLPDGIPKDIGKVGIRMFGRRFVSDKQFAKLVECAEKSTVHRYEKKEEAVGLLVKTNGMLSHLEQQIYQNRHMSANEFSKWTQGVNEVKGVLANSDECAKEARMPKNYQEPRLLYSTYGREREVINVRIRDLEGALKVQENFLQKV